MFDWEAKMRNRLNRLSMNNYFSFPVDKMDQRRIYFTKHRVLGRKLDQSTVIITHEFAFPSQIRKMVKDIKGV